MNKKILIGIALIIAIVSAFIYFKIPFTAPKIPLTVYDIAIMQSGDYCLMKIHVSNDYLSDTLKERLLKQWEEYKNMTKEEQSEFDEKWEEEFEKLRIQLALRNCRIEITYLRQDGTWKTISKEIGFMYWGQSTEIEGIKLWDFASGNSYLKPDGHYHGDVEPNVKFEAYGSRT